MKIKPLRASKVKDKTKRIPSGVFSFDVLTGGGLPENKITIFWGSKSSGKTTMALKIIGNYLQMFKDKEVLYVDLEDSFDKEWASRFIEDEDFDRVLLIRPLYAEEAIDAMVDILNSDEYNIGFLMIDSLANMVPIADFEKSASEDTVGMQARVINKMIRKLLPIKSAMNKEGKTLTCIFINQVRSKIGARAFTPDSTKPGGHYQDFVAHMIIRFYAVENVTKGDVTIKVKHQFKIEKAKVNNAIQGRKGAFSLVLVDHEGMEIGQTDDYNIILNSAKKFKVLERIGNKWKFNENVFTTQADVLTRMREDIKFYVELYETTMNKMITDVIPGGEND